MVLNNPVHVTREMWVLGCGMVERISYTVDIHDGTNVNDTALCSNFHIRHYLLCILQIDGSILRWVRVPWLLLVRPILLTTSMGRRL